LIRWSVVAVAAIMALLAATTLWVDSLPVMMTLLFIGFGFLGLLLPAAGAIPGGPWCRRQVLRRPCSVRSR
jgi:DHA1 family bicyclomycin/chloramphenicol resistance-like MFS transporter